jgi:hypothetical protein
MFFLSHDRFQKVSEWPNNDIAVVTVRNIHTHRHHHLTYFAGVLFAVRLPIHLVPVVYNLDSLFQSWSPTTIKLWQATHGARRATELDRQPIQSLDHPHEPCYGFPGGNPP